MKNEKIIKDFSMYTLGWIKSFNKGDVEACINSYTDDAVMVVKNIGEFKGKKAIADFWYETTKTANHIEYSNTNIKVINEKTVHLSSDWKMNIAEGVITLEEWSKQDDNSWKLVQDEFEILKQY
jgi:ketosteroid isomerase-like protein